MQAHEKKDKQKIQHYLKLPYRRELIPNADGTWFAHVVEFQGCQTEGDTPEAALAALRVSMNNWLAERFRGQEPIPAPSRETQYSGKFVVRVPRSLHRELAEQAERDNVSLNQFVSTALSRSVNPGERVIVSTVGRNGSNCEAFKVGSRERAVVVECATGRVSVVDDHAVERRAATAKTNSFFVDPSSGTIGYRGLTADLQQIFSTARNGDRALSPEVLK